MKRMPFDPSNPYIPSEEELEAMKNFENTDYSDSPRLAPEQLKLARKAMKSIPSGTLPYRSRYPSIWI